MNPPRKPERVVSITEGECDATVPSSGEFERTTNDAGLIHTAKYGLHEEMDKAFMPPTKPERLASVDESYL